MTALPGRCAGCTERVWWAGYQWRDGPTQNHAPHRCTLAADGNRRPRLPRRTHTKTQP